MMVFTFTQEWVLMLHMTLLSQYPQPTWKVRKESEHLLPLSSFSSWRYLAWVWRQLGLHREGAPRNRVTIVGHVDAVDSLLRGGVTDQARISFGRLGLHIAGHHLLAGTQLMTHKCVVNTTFFYSKTNRLVAIKVEICEINTHHCHFQLTLTSCTLCFHHKLLFVIDLHSCNA